MKPFLQLLFLVTLTAICPPLFGQSASMVVSTPVLSPRGGEVRLSAATWYDGQPAALGWSLTIPAGWTLARVEGPNIPAVAAEPGATEVLEFAFTNVPQGRTEFTIVLHYPSQVTAAIIAGTAHLRWHDANPVTVPVPSVRLAQKRIRPEGSIER